jgi:hypothetical protein
VAAILEKYVFMVWDKHDDRAVKGVVACGFNIVASKSTPVPQPSVTGQSSQGHPV